MPESVSQIKQFSGDLLDFFYPPLCLGCGEQADAKAPVCESCLSKIEGYDSPTCLNCFEVVYQGQKCPVCKEDGFLLFTYGDYRDPMAEIIKQLKFKGITYPANLFAELIVSQLGPQIDALDADFLVPIPLHRSREYIRGYNQALIIAENLGRELNIKVDNDLLYRDKKRKPQASLQSGEREANIAGVFQASVACVTATRLILVDDVVTTGSTVSEARKVLMAEGYTVVAAIAIAK
jgi:ComF family protein